MLSIAGGPSILSALAVTHPVNGRVASGNVNSDVKTGIKSGIKIDLDTCGLNRTGEPRKMDGPVCQFYPKK